MANNKSHNRVTDNYLVLQFISDTMIIHADMDAFYASVELLDKPQLTDKPVAVGGPSRSRGVISAANYIARQYGVHSALPTSTAIKRCPDLVLLKPNMDRYAEYSAKIKNIFSEFTPVFEPLALDEAFLDPSGSEKLFGDAITIANNIKNNIKTRLDLTVSMGIARNKFVAKIASDIDKPDGFVVVPPEQTQAFLDPLPVTRIWGIGKVSAAKLHRYGIKTIRQLRLTEQQQLRTWFGNQTDHLLNLANGIDERRVITDHEAKSISHESTFEQDIHNTDHLNPHLLHLTELVCARLRHANITGKTVTIKLRYSDFRTITRSRTLEHPTNQTKAIWQIIKMDILTRLNHTEINRKGVRLLGVGISQLQLPDSPSTQLGLFDQENPNDKIDKLTDAINRRFGANTLSRGTSKKQY